MSVHSKSVFALPFHWKGISTDYKESRNQYPCISQGMESMESNDQASKLCVCFLPVFPVAMHGDER